VDGTRGVRSTKANYNETTFFRGVAELARSRRRRRSRLHAPMVASKKESHWAQYQSLLVRRPVAMNITQGGIITAAGLAPATLLHRTPQHSTSLTTRRHSATTHAIHRTACHLQPGLTLTLLRRHHHRGRQRRRSAVRGQDAAWPSPKPSPKPEPKPRPNPKPAPKPGPTPKPYPNQGHGEHHQGAASDRAG